MRKLNGCQRLVVLESILHVLDFLLLAAERIGVDITS